MRRKTKKDAPDGDAADAAFERSDEYQAWVKRGLPFVAVPGLNQCWRTYPSLPLWHLVNLDHEDVDALGPVFAHAWMLGGIVLTSTVFNGTRPLNQQSMNAALALSADDAPPVGDVARAMLRFRLETPARQEIPLFFAVHYGEDEWIVSPSKEIEAVCEWIQEELNAKRRPRRWIAP